MTKFGTPTGAGPGSASVSDGFESVGVPSALRSAFGSGCSRSTSGRALVSSRKRPGELRRRFVPSVGPVAPVFPVFPVAPVGPVAPFDCGEFFLVPSWTPAIGALISGSLIWSAGVPGGTSTVVTISWPPTSVTVIVRSSATAGQVATAKPATNRASVSPERKIFRLI
jgi:hypothetical protein